LQEAIDLVQNKSVPVNTASRAMNVPKTTLRKALEKLCMGVKVVSKTPVKKTRYQVDDVDFQAGSVSRTSDNDRDAEVVVPEPIDIVKPTMVKSKF